MLCSFCASELEEIIIHYLNQIPEDHTLSYDMVYHISKNLSKRQRGHNYDKFFTAETDDIITTAWYTRKM